MRGGKGRGGRHHPAVLPPRVPAPGAQQAFCAREIRRKTAQGRVERALRDAQMSFAMQGERGKREELVQATIAAAAEIDANEARVAQQSRRTAEQTQTSSSSGSGSASSLQSPGGRSAEKESKEIDAELA